MYKRQVRGQFSVFEFLIQQVKAIGGKFCVSPAAIKTVSVEETENGYKCFFNTDSGTIMNPFVVGDQAFHQVLDVYKRQDKDKPKQVHASQIF